MFIFFIQGHPFSWKSRSLEFLYIYTQFSVRRIFILYRVGKFTLLINDRGIILQCKWIQQIGSKLLPSVSNYDQDIGFSTLMTTVILHVLLYVDRGIEWIYGRIFLIMSFQKSFVSKDKYNKDAAYKFYLFHLVQIKRALYLKS